MSSASITGSIVGTLPAPLVVRRFGLKATLIAASLGVPIVGLFRSMHVAGTVLIGAAFLAGFISAIWAVCLPPVVAALTAENKRALGFSLWTGWGIGLGIVCGVLGGRLPGWIQQLGLASNPTTAKQYALVLGCVLAAMSPLLLAQLTVSDHADTKPRIVPHSPFLTRYMIAFGVWGLAVGSFNPFFSAYFARQLQVPVDRIGIIFSASHVTQLVGVLAAPAILRRFGSVSGIAAMQFGAALMLGTLAFPLPAYAAGAVYTLYMMFQFMSEPGIFTLLMSNALPAERSGVSALNFLVTNCSMALAAAVAGMAVKRFGYPPVLITAAAMAGLAAFLFGTLLVPWDRRNPSASHEFASAASNPHSEI